MTDYTALKERLNRVESFLDDGPWTNEQFSEVMAGGGRDYGGMIMAADGESIVAQCVMEDNLNGLIALRNMVPQLAEAITTLERQFAEAREALGPFDKALGGIAENAVDTWPDNETIEHSGAAEEITWGDLRRARAALKGDQ